MNYLAHFSFLQEDRKLHHGYFTCLLEADSMEESLDKCRALIIRLVENREVLRSPAQIYLDQLIRIDRVPAGGIVAHLAARDGELTSGESVSLPVADEGCCEAFGVAPEGEDDETVDIDPFFILDTE